MIPLGYCLFLWQCTFQSRQSWCSRNSRRLKVTSPSLVLFIAVTVILGIALWTPQGFCKSEIEDIRRRFAKAPPESQPILLNEVSFESSCYRVLKLVLLNIVAYLILTSSETAPGWTVLFCVLEMLVVYALIVHATNRLREDLSHSENIRARMAKSALLF